MASNTTSSSEYFFYLKEKEMHLKCEGKKSEKLVNELRQYSNRMHKIIRGFTITLIIGSPANRVCIHIYIYIYTLYLYKISGVKIKAK